MSKVLVMGATLPEYHPKQEVTIAANLRTEQLVHALKAAGHDVAVIGSDYHGAAKKKAHFTKAAKNYWHTDLIGEKLHQSIRQVIKKFKPDCLVGITVWPSMELIGAGSDLPMWIDIFGNTMTEAQLICAQRGDNRYLKQFWAHEKRLLERGDKFSGCSERQEHFMVAELAMLGRLSAETFGYRFVHSIPPGVPDGVPEPTWKGSAIRGHDGIEADDFVVLWTGGYNLWTDVDTLVTGLELAMAQNPKIKFVSFGGEIAGHDEQTYPHFIKLVEKSKFKDRFVLLGWQPYQRMLKALTEANLGICIDKWHYELVYGTRTRLTQMIAYGLPVLTTGGCELIDDLQHRTGINIFKIGNASHCASQIIALTEGRPWKPSSGGLSYQATCLPLTKWCNDPKRAPVSTAGHVYDQSCQDAIAELIAYAACKIREHRDAMAIGVLNTVLDIKQENTLAWYHLGGIYERAGEHKLAISCFIEASKKSHLQAGAWYHIAVNTDDNVLARLRHLDKCLRYCPDHKAAKQLRKLTIKQLAKTT